MSGIQGLVAKKRLGEGPQNTEKGTIKTKKKDVEKDIKLELMEVSAKAEKIITYSTNVDPIEPINATNLEARPTELSGVSAEINDLFNENSSIENGATGDSYDVTKHGGGAKRKNINRKFKN